MGHPGQVSPLVAVKGNSIIGNQFAQPIV